MEDPSPKDDERDQIEVGGLAPKGVHAPKFLRPRVQLPQICNCLFAAVEESPKPGDNLKAFGFPSSSSSQVMFASVCQTDVSTVQKRTYPHHFSNQLLYVTMGALELDQAKCTKGSL